MALLFQLQLCCGNLVDWLCTLALRVVVPLKPNLLSFYAVHLRSNLLYLFSPLYLNTLYKQERRTAYLKEVAYLEL